MNTQTFFGNSMEYGEPNNADRDYCDIHELEIDGYCPECEADIADLVYDRIKEEGN